MKYIRVMLNEMKISCETIKQAEAMIEELIAQGHNKDELYIHCTDVKEFK